MTDILKETCRQCGQKLIRFPWNREEKMITCDNVRCSIYRQPSEIVKGTLHKRKRLKTTNHRERGSFFIPVIVASKHLSREHDGEDNR